MIETIADAGVVVAYIARVQAAPAETTYMTPDDCALQVGHVVYPAGGEIPRHIHLPIERHLVGTAEVLILQSGRCEVDIYNQDQHLVTTRELRAGDMLISVTGGHGFRVIEDMVLLEIKQGPYPGGAEKARF